MSTKTEMRHGGRILVDQLALHGAERVFLVPGESYLAVLDGLVDHPDIDPIICRQEGGAAIMAEAYGKLTGKPGICMVTRGPGATNASAGVHVAHQDSTPMILLVGQIGRDMVDREAFQEVDYRKMFEPLAKWVGQIDDINRIPEYLSHAYHIATSGRPGPVVLALPEDMLSGCAEVADAKPYVPIEAKTAPDDVARFHNALKEAKQPIMIVGGGGWTREATENLKSFATRNNVAIATSFRCQDYIPNTHSHFIGDVGIGINPKLAEFIRDSDLVILVGSRMGEMTSSGYDLLDIPCPRQKLIHVYAGPDELGRVYRPDIAINASQRSFIRAIAMMEPVDGSARDAQIENAHAAYLKFSTPLDTPGDVKMAHVVAELREKLPDNAIVTNGAGNYAAFLHRFFRYRDYRTELAPTSGSMGYGLPASVSAKLTHPDRPVVCLAGDGCFLMHGQEFATAVQYGANIITLVINNGMFGTIRMHQERNYPGRVSGTELHNPDFAAYAKAFGGYGETVTRTEDFGPAFDRAVASGKPAILEIQVDPQALTPIKTLDQIRTGS
ncbi:thiamine pyrophosphate-binding protein [Thalassospira lucentensis]|uniref:thiamine pyrophosphate-binding protein n=1 Tax=Thalassospira lucentensis TaxID=168935 RepID=UPI00142E63C7|nr:thiamine pyrophosphate-binding protein [Thalassospira lucentensis]NIZ00654.1 thiamine pyrophosphate-binding protein [Thalassospira lucentensis]